jgi:2',3'-cyclic-nucleotide 2'-phosphodiesterase (5'-nucleotidase family)
MLGGLARRVAFVEKMRAAGAQILVVDSGDLFFDSRASEDSSQIRTKARLIGRAYKRMGASAINVGDLDLIQGLDFLRQESSHGLPLISANLLDSSSKHPIFSPYIIKEISGIRVAFFGLLSPEFRPEIELIIQKSIGAKILVKDPGEAAQETLQRLRGQADLVVLLSDLGLHKDQFLAKAVPGIHFILGGHEGRFILKSHQTEATHIFQSSAKGMYVGQLRLAVENPGSPFKDERGAQNIQEKINSLQLRLRSLQAAKARRSGQNVETLDQAMQDATRQKNDLEEELRRAKESGIQGNRFLFTLEPMELRLPEDEEVRKWTAGAGIDKD